MSSPKVSLLILNYGKTSRVIQNVESLVKQKINFDLEIIVMDNSEDLKNQKRLRKLEPYSQVKVIMNSVNLGYTKAHNQAAKNAKGSYLAIVNPDILWKTSDALQKMVDFLDTHSKVSIVAPQQLIENTQDREITIRAFPKLWRQICRRTWLKHLPWIRKAIEKDEMTHLDYNQTQSVPWAQSSCLLIRKNFWELVGGFDEDYFLFLADTEICWQAWEKGRFVVYYPDAIVYADGQRLSHGGFWKFFTSWIIRQHVKDALKFTWKHRRENEPKILPFTKNSVKK